MFVKSVVKKNINMNKTTKMLHTISISLLMLFFSSCDKEKQEILDNVWQIENIKIHTDSLLVYPPHSNYILEFKNTQNYSFQIGSNISAGKVKFKRNNNVDFNGSITFAAWDNEFSEKVFAVFSIVNIYKYTETTLILKDDNGGFLKFKKI